MAREPFDPEKILAGKPPLDPQLEALAHDVIGAAIEVHREMGAGYPEIMYEEALCHELTLRGIPHLRQAPIDVFYKGKRVGEGRMDLLVGGRLVVELKSAESISPVFVAQALSYLKATKHRLALVINFNAVVLKHGIRRVIM